MADIPKTPREIIEQAFPGGYTHRDEANAMVAMAFRNGPIEDLHAGEYSELLERPELSRITDDEMKAIMLAACEAVEKLLREKEEDTGEYYLKMMDCSPCSNTSVAGSPPSRSTSNRNRTASSFWLAGRSPSASSARISIGSGSHSTYADPGTVGDSINLYASALGSLPWLIFIDAKMRRSGSSFARSTSHAVRATLMKPSDPMTR